MRRGGNSCLDITTKLGFPGGSTQALGIITFPDGMRSRVSNLVYFQAALSSARLFALFCRHPFKHIADWPAIFM